MRVVAFAFLTPFFFLRGGLNVSLGAVFANLGVLALLAGAKMIPKLGLVFPLARRHARPNAAFTTLLMSTGLTFGTISALYGLSAHVIDRTQFSLLVTVVVLSAIVPTAIAQRWFSPPTPPEQPHHLVMPEPSDLRYHWVRVRLAAIDRQEMREIVLDAWRMVVPKRVAAAHLGD